MADFFDGWWERKRKAYKKLPLVLRVFLATLAFILGPLGVVAMFTPLAVLEVGSILVFTSLTILSFEFDWSYNLLVLLRRKLQDRTFHHRVTYFTITILIIYVVIIVSKLASAVHPSG